MVKNNKPSIIETMVESLKPFTSNNIFDIQSAKSPRLADLGLVYQNEYYLDGVKYPIYENNTLVYMVKRFPFKNKLNKILFKDTLLNLIISNQCSPILIFIDGVFIKWSNIEVICDTYYNYIKINNVKNYNINCKIDTIIIPNKIKYIENAITCDGLESFIFDTNGKITYDINDSNTTIIDIKDLNILYESSNINFNEKIATTIKPNFILNRANIFIFNDGLFTPNKQVVIHPKNIIYIPKENESTDTINYKIFYNYSGLENKENITHLINNEYIIDKILHETDIDYIYKLGKEFNFDYDKSMSRQDWIIEIIKYILSYNKDLISNHISNMSQIKCIKYKGSELLNAHPGKDSIFISRRYNECLETGIMVFNNGELLENHDLVYYKDKSFNLPLTKIKPDDNIEIYYFLNIDNDVIDLPFLDIFTLPEFAIGYKDITKSKVFTDNPDNLEFNIGYKDSIQYEVDYDYIKIKDGIYNIIPNNSIYRSTFKLVSDRQFRYMRYTETIGDTIKIPLTDDFKFCNDEDRYVVFLNGRRLYDRNVRFTIPRKTRPFDKLMMYLNVPISKGDKVDIFYTSIKLEEIEHISNVKNSTITVDMSKLGYPLNPNLYMFFLNGKKLKTENLVYIDYNTIKINPPKDEPEESIYNLSVIKYIDSKDIIKGLFDGNDYLTDILKDLSNDEINRIFNITGIMNDNESSNTEVDEKAVIYEIIKDFYCRPYINQGEPFIYDYDISKFYNYDDKDNIIINVLNAKDTDKINIIKEE